MAVSRANNNLGRGAFFLTRPKFLNIQDQPQPQIHYLQVFETGKPIADANMFSGAGKR